MILAGIKSYKKQFQYSNSVRERVNTGHGKVKNQFNDFGSSTESVLMWGLLKSHGINMIKQALSTINIVSTMY